MKFKNIASRIIFSTLPIIALCTVVFIVFGYYFSSKQINKAVNERMKENLESAGLKIQIELQKNAEIARSMARSTQLLNINGDISFDRYNRFITDLVISAIASNPNTVGGGIWFEPYKANNLRYYGPYVYMENNKPVFVEDYSEKGTNNFHAADWYLNGKNALKPEIVWSGVYYDPVAKVTMITATKPMRDRKGNFIGVTTADMAMDDIKKIVDSLSTGATGRAVLVDRNGSLVSFQNGAEPLADEPKPDGIQAKVSNFLYKHKAGVFRFEEDGVKKRIYFNSIAGVNWSLGIVIDESEIGNNMLSQFMLLTMIPFLGFILSIISTIAVARYFRRIVNKVNHFAALGARGDFTRRIEVTEEDEFAYMEERLNIMMANMADMSKHSQEMLDLANAASKAKGAFLSRMSHEIRTPMNAIIGMSQIAAKTDDINKMHECMAKINTASHHLLSLINDILDMAKIEADKLELVKEEFNLEQLINNIKGVISVKAEEKDLKLKFKIDETLPPCVIGDDLRLSQVITNLLSNAVKFTPPKGEISLEVRSLEHNGSQCTLQFDIKDSGIGLAPDQQGTKLFEAFEQADGSTSRKFGGTGLGLAISKRIVEIMGGTIWVESEEGQGSTFSFTAKFDCGESKAEVSKKDEDTMPRADDLSRYRILLVEDIDINREIVLSLLEECKILIDTAENGEEAYKKYSADPGRYDLIIMDVQMPIMDGLEATRKIRAMEDGRGGDVPILAMTANAFKEDVENTKKAGMTDYMSKPIDYNILIEKLRQNLPPK